MDRNRTKAAPSDRSEALIALCGEADALHTKAVSTYLRDDFKAAAQKCMAAAVAASREERSDWANHYGRLYAEMNRKSCGG